MILHHGLVRMVEKQDNVYYYLTLLNENYAQPGLKPRHRGGDRQGHVPAAGRRRRRRRASTCSAAARSCARASPRASCSRSDWGIAANVWSCPSFNELARDGQDAERWNLLHPTERPRVPFVAQQLEKYAGPVIASTDYMKNYAEQIRAFMPKGRTLQGARHRRLRPQRLPHQAARALRGQPPLHRRRGAEGARRRGQRAGRRRSPRRSRKYGIDADKINPLYA